MMHGNTNFSEGGFFYDNIYAMKNYGLVPEEAYPNTQRKGASIYHFGFSGKMKTYLDSVATDDNKTIDPKWFEIFTQKTDDFLGTVPQEFEYKGKTYTPKTFAQEVVKLNPDDYVQITSFTHHPFYEAGRLESRCHRVQATIPGNPLKPKRMILRQDADSCPCPKRRDR